jgi:hypothetical protein
MKPMTPDVTVDLAMPTAAACAAVLAAYDAQR